MSEKKKHNPKTRGINTKRRGVVWGKRTRTVGKGDAKRTIEEDVKVPSGTLWNPELLYSKRLDFPFDTLNLDWAEEIGWWAAENRFKIYKEKLGEHFEYRIRDEYGNLMLTIETTRDVILDARPKHKRRRRNK